MPSALLDTAGNGLTANSAQPELRTVASINAPMSSSGNDTLTGTSGDDTLYGLAGDDIIAGGSGRDHVYGGVGNDTVVIDYGTATADLSLDYLPSQPTIIGYPAPGGTDFSGMGSTGRSGGRDVVYGVLDLTADDALYWGPVVGSAMDGSVNSPGEFMTFDSISGNKAIWTGSFQLNGQTVYTRFYATITAGGAWEAAGTHGLDGSLGAGGGLAAVVHVGATPLTMNWSFTASYAPNGVGEIPFLDFYDANSVTENLGRTSISGYFAIDDGGYAGTLADGMGNETAFHGIEAFDVTTGSGNDVLNGGALADRFVAGAGNDTLNGAGGNDTLNGGAGNDLIDGGADNDVLNGDAGDDLIMGGSGDDMLDGGDDNDILEGGAGNDVIDGGAGIDTASYAGAAAAVRVTLLAQGAYQGTDSAGADKLLNIENLTGSSYDDILTGDDGANALDGGAGVDRLVGGLGDDTYVIDTINDVIAENPGEGIDTVVAPFSYSLVGKNIENLTLTGTGNLSATGNDVANVLTGNAGDNFITGGAGADTMIGADGDDFYVVDTINDQIVEKPGEGYDSVNASTSYVLSANIEKLTLTGTANYSATGNAQDNWIIGNSGSNVIDGGGGADQLQGGLGDDIYYVDNAGDVVIENSGEGTDTVRTTMSYSLAGSFIENLTLIGSGNIDGTGNGLANILVGNSGNNHLDGGGGADRMVGGLGDDTYSVNDPGDVVVEYNGEGNDTIRSTISFSLAGYFIENLIVVGSSNLSVTGNGLDNYLEGNAGDNVIDGAQGNDRIDGGAGADVMRGGIGDDSYYVDNASDIVIENGHEGYDSVYSSVSFNLSGQSLEKLVLTGAGNINGTGNGLDNIVTGNAGNNVIDGGAGADSMRGGMGDDSYYVDNAGDVVVENSNAGTDTVYASVSYGLSGQFIENLTLLGSGNIDAAGNGLPNIIIGNSGNNRIDGGFGADRMVGGLGDDTYSVDNAGDVVVENSGEGNDTIRATISYSLAGQFIENLIVVGTANLNATGNSLDNYLQGNFGSNVIDGGLGNDRIDGGAGADTLTGGTGADHFIFDSPLFASNVDTITDFSHAEGDVIELDDAIFTAIGGTGTLIAAAFYTGSTAHDADDRILYDPLTGWLYYDADGNGAGAAQHFATLASGIALNNSDFVVV